MAGKGAKHKFKKTRASFPRGLAKVSGALRCDRFSPHDGLHDPAKEISYLPSLAETLMNPSNHFNKMYRRAQKRKKDMRNFKAIQNKLVNHLVSSGVTKSVARNFVNTDFTKIKKLSFDMKPTRFSEKVAIECAINIAKKLKGIPIKNRFYPDSDLQ